MTTPRQQVGARLRQFITDMDLTVVATAGLLKCTHPAVLDWCSGAKVPSEPWRRAIARLTARWQHGPITEEEWGQTAYEARVSSKLNTIEPYERPTPAEPVA